jgi:hypothetical protein
MLFFFHHRFSRLGARRRCAHTAFAVSPMYTRLYNIILHDVYMHYACTSVTVFRRLIDYTPLPRRSLRPEHYSDPRKRMKRRPRTFSDGNLDRIMLN